MTIKLHPVKNESSQIHSIGFHAPSGTLAIRFKSKTGIGNTYHYQNVSQEQYEALENAESHGQHFAMHIKSNQAKHPYIKVS